LDKSPDVELTKEKAIAKVLQRRPDLYDAYLAEGN
jgi:hypothetical protein